MFNLYLLFILVVTYVSGTPDIISFPEALYPKDATHLQSKCPLQLRKIDFCASRYEECFGRSRSVVDCSNEFCGCSKMNDDSNKQECKRYSNDVCFTVNNNGHRFQREIIKKRQKLAFDNVKKRFKHIIETYKIMVEDCGVESKLKLETEEMKKKLKVTNAMHDLALPFFAMINVEHSLNKSKKCLMRIDEFETSLEEADSKASESLKHPYLLWHTGIEFGPIGKVVTRIGIDELCGKISFELNQESAAHLDCKAARQECDEKYIENINYLLKTMDSKKLDCQLMVELMGSIHVLRGEKYRETSEFHSIASTTSIRGKFNVGFNGFENGSMTKQETKTPFVDLEASQKSTFQIKDRFESVSFRCGGSKNSADTVASCGLRYEYCIHFNEKDCRKQLSICLNPIDDENKECKDSIFQLTELLWPTAMKTEYSQGSGFGIWHIFALIITGILFVVVGYGFCKFRTIKEKICGRTEQSEGHELTPMVTPQIEANNERRLNPNVHVNTEDSPPNNNENVPEILEDLSNNERAEPESMKHYVVDEASLMGEIQKDPSQPSTSS